mmetsp:Transcript_14644/g.42139  ORF Transcript_14644/g.42139 Transcript_14644/m.42139 type:complete len:262 (+) Transcript_14644:2454-3239(+)
MQHKKRRQRRRRRTPTQFCCSPFLIVRARIIVLFQFCHGPPTSQTVEGWSALQKARPPPAFLQLLLPACLSLGLLYLFRLLQMLPLRTLVHFGFHLLLFLFIARLFYPKSMDITLAFLQLSICRILELGDLLSEHFDPSLAVVRRLRPAAVVAATTYGAVLRGSSIGGGGGGRTDCTARRWGNNLGTERATSIGITAPPALSSVSSCCSCSRRCCCPGFRCRIIDGIVHGTSPPADGAGTGAGTAAGRLLFLTPTGISISH